MTALSGLGLIFQNGRLQVLSQFQWAADLVEIVTVCLLYLWKFQRFTDSRWVAVGPSCRSFCLGMLTGVDHLVNYVINKQGVSKFHIDGATNSQGRVRKFVVMVAITSYPSYSLLD